MRNSILISGKPFLVLLWVVLCLSCGPYRMPHGGSASSPKSGESRISDSLRISQAIEAMDTASLPEYIIYINLHYVRHPVIGNFYRGSVDDHNPANGLFWAGLLINHVNWQLDSLRPGRTSLKDFIGNARYRFQLYSEPGNALDSFGGIWFWDGPFYYDFPYGDRVLNVVLLNDPSRKLNGDACGLDMCERVSLFGAFDNISNNGIFGWWSFAGLLNHEFGHLLGLCHSFSCDNECNGIDLDAGIECAVNPCYASCGGPNYKACNNWDSGSSNMMGYNPDQCSLTPCQWKRIMHTLHTTRAKYVKRMDGTTPH